MEKQKVMRHKKKTAYPSPIIICCASGKSGGHIIPNLTYALEYKKKYTEKNQPPQILFISSSANLDAQILHDNKKIDVWDQLTINLSSRLLFMPLNIYQLMRATLKSFFILLKARPTIILSTGGIVAVPVCIASWLLRIPINLYELNAVPGKATKFLAPLASEIFVCFKKTQTYFKQSKIIPYPIRFTQSDHTHNNQTHNNHTPNNTIHNTKNSSPLFPHFCPKRKTILILGGSQGSRALNNIIKQTLESHTLLHDNVQVIHQHGPHNTLTIKNHTPSNTHPSSHNHTFSHESSTLHKNTLSWPEFYNSLNIPAITCEFNADTKQLTQYYQKADLVICRAGAGSIFETLFFKSRAS